MAKIYVASSWRNRHQEDVVNFFIDKGHEVYDFRNPPHGKGGFAWSDIETRWQDWSVDEYVQALKHPIAEHGFNSDFDGMKWADVCVMVLPCGRSANSEAGWMKGAGKRVFVYYPGQPRCLYPRPEPELMYKLYDGISDSLSRINHLIKSSNKCYKTGDPCECAGLCRENY